ncbi:MAG TPA: glycoside hydrolase family 3 C-terminal domain-containing protein [Phototrophicaceae bacterium]|nr:glycoside hydrolase family 3 C-terminal domain-containing protein [Phototrophicaceae bacterium]
MTDDRAPRRRRPLAAGMAGALGALLLAAASTPAGAAVDDPPFRDPDVPLEQRVEDLVSRLTLEEKVSLMHQWQPEIDRLGLPAFRTGTEALHGVAWLGEATVFPQAIGLGSTWDPELLGRVGEVVGTEARGFHHLDPDYHGLNLWAPVVDLLRDPRAGRNEEGYSEDAHHTGVMSTAYAAGIQGDDETYLRAAPMLKHFIGYNNEVDRDRTNSSLPPRALHEYWLPAFEPALSAGAANGVMASYNLVNGRPAHLSPLLEHARGWSEDEILVVSDAYAPGNVVDVQGYYDTHAESHAALVRAGVDSFTDRGEDSSFTIGNLTDALEQGLLTEEDLDGALRHMLPVRFRLGDFDPEGLNPYEDITEEVINAPEHEELAHEAALAQMVLLENDREALPLGGDGSVAVVGPLSDTLYEDWYSGTMPYRVTALDGLTERLGADRVTTSEGVDSVALRVAETGAYLTAPTDDDGGQLTAGPDTAGPTETMALFDWGQGVYALRTEANGKYVSRGWDDVVRNDQHQPNGWEVRETFTLEDAEDGTVLVRNVQNGRYLAVGDDGGVTAAAEADGATRFVLETLSDGAEEAVAVAAEADTAVVVVGNNPYINGRETQDRADLALSPAQEELVAAVAEANENVVVVLMTSYPVTLPQDLPTVLWTSHAGQETGTALAEVLLGDVSPAGRLTQTWYRSVEDLPESILEYDISQAGTTYQHFAGDPLYPFGHGLTYTEFEYSDARLGADEVAPDGTVEVAVDVTNVGGRDSDEVVQLYTRTLDAPVAQPLQTLRDFVRVSVPAGETRTVTFELPAAQLAYWDVETDAEVVAPGRYDVLVGASSQDVRSTAHLVVSGDVVPRERDLTDGEDAVDFDAYAGVEVVDRSRTEGDSAGVTAGDWLAFHDVRFSPAAARAFEVRAARESTEPAVVEVRLGAPDGELLGTVEVPGTGDRYAYEVASAELAEAEAGVHDVYLVAAGDARLATVRLVETPVPEPSPEPTPPEPGEPTPPPTDGGPSAEPAPTDGANGPGRLPTTGVGGAAILAALGLLGAGAVTLGVRRRLG